MRESYIVWVDEYRQVMDSYNVTDQITIPAGTFELIDYKSYKELEEKLELCKKAMRAELDRCGGTVPILSKALKELEEI